MPKTNQHPKYKGKYKSEIIAEAIGAVGHNADRVIQYAKDKYDCHILKNTYHNYTSRKRQRQKEANPHVAKPVGKSHPKVKRMPVTVAVTLTPSNLKAVLIQLLRVKKIADEVGIDRLEELVAAIKVSHSTQDDTSL